MKTTVPKFKQGDRVITPNGPGTIFEHFLGFYSVEVDGYRKDQYFMECYLQPENDPLSVFRDSQPPNSNKDANGDGL